VAKNLDFEINFFFNIMELNIIVRNVHRRNVCVSRHSGIPPRDSGKKIFLLELSELLWVSQLMGVMCIMGNTTDKLVLK
jgi:hypothetical protein